MPWVDSGSTAPSSLPTASRPSSRSASGIRPPPPAPPRCGPSPPTSPTCCTCWEPTWSLAGAISRPRARSRGRASDVARGSRAGDLRRLPSRAGAVGEALDGGRPGSAGRPGRGESRQAAQLRVWFCAKGLRAHAELAALAPAGMRTPSMRGSHREGASSPSLDAARRRPQRSHRTRPAGSPWPRRSTSVCRASHGRSCGQTRQRRGNSSSGRRSRPTAAGARPRRSSRRASRVEASAPLREARAVATRIGAQPLLHEVELLARRARLDRRSAGGGRRADGAPRPWRRSLGLTAARGRGPRPRRPRLHQPRDEEVRSRWRIDLELERFTLASLRRPLSSLATST